MATTTELRVGQRVELDGEPYVIVDASTQSPSARGGLTLVKTKLRHLRSKQLVSRTFKSGERVKVPDFEMRNAQYLYADGQGGHVFMDQETFDQYAVPEEVVADELGYVRLNDTVRAMMFEGECIGIEVPPTVTLEVAECDPSVRGDTVTAVTKNARMETGLEVQVPMFVNPGDRLIIDTRERRYVRRG